MIVLKAGAFADAGFFGAKAVSFPYYSISSVEHRQGAFGGHITILAAGVLENRPDTSFTSVTSNTKRENVVTYQRRALRESVDAMVRIIQENVHAAHKPASVTVASGSGDGLADQLLKLNKLREEGVLTDDEFATAKARLL